MQNGFREGEEEIVGAGRGGKVATCEIKRKNVKAKSRC